MIKYLRWQRSSNALKFRDLSLLPRMNVECGIAINGVILCFDNTNDKHL
jgi:hypothetical protein